MPKKEIYDPRQMSITSFFPKLKGPLKIESKHVISSTENEKLLKQYRRRRRKRHLTPENITDDNSDVVYIKTEKFVTDQTNHSEGDNRPISPNIILTTEFGCVKYLSSNVSSSINEYWNNNGSEVSPSKLQRTETSVIGELTLTKSKIQSKKIEKKISRTLQMTQSSNSMDLKVESTNASELSAIMNSIQKPILSEPTDITNILEVQLLEDQEYIHKITNHVELVNEIIETATTTYLSNLLFENENNILKEYQMLTLYQKYFVCKLFTRQIKWYNAFKLGENIHLSVNEFKMNDIVKCLADRSFLKTDYSSEEMISLLNFLSINDVKYVHDALRLKTLQKNKPKLINAILNHINNQTTLHPTISLEKKVRQMVSDRLGQMVQITPLFYTAFYKVHLLYTFTNPEFDIPSGLYLRLYDIKYGNILHPNYVCKDDVIFEDAEDFSNFYKAFSYKNEVMQALQKKGDLKFTTMFDLSKEIVNEFAKILSNINVNNPNNRPSHLKRLTAGHQYASALWLLCEHLGSKHPNEVREWLEMLLGQTYFYQRKRGLWYAKLSLIYNAHLKEGNKAVETLTIGLKDKLVSLVDMSEIVYRSRSYCKKKKLNTTELSTHLSLWNESIPDSDTFPFVSIKALANNSSETARQGDYKYMTSNGDIMYMNVEEIAIRHYRDKEGLIYGVHCEGALMQAIFHILFWNITFTTGIPYTFISKMQYLPLDFYSPEFYYNRKTEIDKRLSDIKTNWSIEYLRTYLLETWNIVSSYKTLVLPGFVTDGENLFNIVTCIGRSVVSEICYRLVQNFRDHRAGMPDLFVYNENRCKFVEVKGPGDKLSSKQKLWINFLLSIGANAEVCYVSKIGCNQRSKK